MARKAIIVFICFTLFGTAYISVDRKISASGKGVKIKGVPAYHQFPHLPTGCEATSLAMLLSWGGENVSKFEVVDKLPKGDKVELIDDELKGANPNEEFVGDPYSDEGSFGVFEGPILETIDTFMPGKGVDLTGQSFDSLLDIVRSGKPVMAWTTIEQKQTFHSVTWTDDAGNKVKWHRYEHAVVITGIDGEYVIVNDPYTGKEAYYNRELFERNWASMGKRAVTLDAGKSDKQAASDENAREVRFPHVKKKINMFSSALHEDLAGIGFNRFAPANFWSSFMYLLPDL